VNGQATNNGRPQTSVNLDEQLLAGDESIPDPIHEDINKQASKT
jgi:hypothetical protein